MVIGLFLQAGTVLANDEEGINNASGQEVKNGGEQAGKDDDDKSNADYRINTERANTLRKDSTTRTRDGLGYDDVNNGTTTTTTTTTGTNVGTQINQLGSMLATMSCKNGETRTVDNSGKDVVWPAMAEPKPPRIYTSSASGHGHYKVDGAEDLFNKLGKLKLPGPGGKVFKVGTMVGKAASKAADKWAKQNAGKLVDLTVKIDRMKVELQCAAIEVCTDGAWVAGGMAPIDGSEKRSSLKPKVYRTRQSIGGKEVPGHVRRAINAARPLFNAYDAYRADPCSGGSSSGGTGGGKGGGTTTGGGTKVATGGGGGGKAAAKNCKPILDEIKANKKQQKVVNEQHIQAQLVVLDLDVKLAKARLDEVNEKSPVEAQLTAANKELAAAKAALQRLIDYSRDAFNPDFGAALKRADKRVKTAKANVKKLTAKLKAITAKYQAIITRIKGEIVAARKKVAELKKKLDRLRKEEEVLWDKYSECLQGN
ncbi:MAG: hypothetical protein BMS9Abin26_1742 [Gammaproteobacteria bacterium]|nr:MAG: hypothetical protein BMS9Abin26_1742 [Gammaproteobacteria bacterium]